MKNIFFMKLFGLLRFSTVSSCSWMLSLVITTSRSLRFFLALVTFLGGSWIVCASWRLRRTLPLRTSDTKGSDVGGGGGCGDDGRSSGDAGRVDRLDSDRAAISRDWLKRSIDSLFLLVWCGAPPQLAAAVLSLMSRLWLLIMPWRAARLASLFLRIGRNFCSPAGMAGDGSIRSAEPRFDLAESALPHASYILEERGRRPAVEATR